jgi:hypothetical protein
MVTEVSHEMKQQKLFNLYKSKNPVAAKEWQTSFYPERSLADDLKAQKLKMQKSTVKDKPS